VPLASVLDFYANESEVYIVRATEIVYEVDRMDERNF